MGSKVITNKKEKIIDLLKADENINIYDLKTKYEIDDIELRNLLISLLFETMTTSTSENKFEINYDLCSKIINLLTKLDISDDFLLEKINSIKLVSKKYEGKYGLNKRETMFELLVDVIKDITPKEFSKLKDVIANVIKNDISNYYLIQSMINIYIYYQYFDNSAVTEIFYLEKMIKELSLNYNGSKEKIISYLTAQQEKFKKPYNIKKEYQQIKRFREKLEEILNNKKKVSKKIYIDNADEHFYMPNYSVLSKLETRGSDLLDLRSLPTITLDRNGTASFDDAFSIDINNNGNYLVSVHISNVADSIDFGTDIEKNAYFQGETVYNPNYKKLMLPDAMSYDKFTLKEGENREVITYIYELTPKFELVDFKVKRGIINVDKNIYFSDVDNRSFMGILNQNYDMLKLAYRVSKGLLDYRYKFENKNVKFFPSVSKKSNSLNNFGIILHTLKGLLEYSMYHYYSQNDLPYIYRAQTDYAEKISSRNLKRDWSQRKDLNKIYDYIKKTPLSNHYLTTLDMQFDDVIYHLIPNSSPIRRYSSFIAQKMVISFMIEGNKYDQMYIKKLKNQLNMIANYLNVNRNVNSLEDDNVVKEKTIS